MTTESDKVKGLIRRLQDVTEQLESDHCDDDHAYWLHVDSDVLTAAIEPLEKLALAIEDERFSPPPWD